MAHEVRYDRRMSDAEGLMWRLEKDPSLSSTVAMVTVLDQAPDVERLRRRLARAVVAVPRLRQRVRPAPLNLGPPTWSEDLAFDLRYHLRHVALPAPGTMRQLLDFASLVAGDPFDRTRPLWEFIVVDGLQDGRSALVQKLHHTITDGQGGVRLSMQFLDLERHPPEPPPLDDVHPHADETAGLNPLDAAKDVLAGTLRVPVGAARQVGSLLASPLQIPSAGVAAVGSLKSVATQLADTERAHSPLWTQRSLRRHVQVLRVPFLPTKAAAKALGGTLNTAFVTAAADAAGEYHRRKGTDVDVLRASMAVSTRTDESGANAFGLARLDVPTGPLPIAERFGLIQALAATARGSAGSGNLQLLAALTAALPTSLVTRLARAQAQTVDFATSNVKAAPFSLYLAGARIMENYPIGPTAGVAFNLTLMSYDASLDIGVNMDAAAIDDPVLLATLIEDAFTALHDAAAG